MSTDKVDSEVTSSYDGVLLEILVNAGDTVPVGTPLARIGEPGAAAGSPRPRLQLRSGTTAAAASRAPPAGRAYRNDHPAAC